MNALYSHEDGILFRHWTSSAPDVQGGELLWCARGPDESNRNPVRVQNACGVVTLEHQDQRHVAWKRHRSIFGTIHKAFTLGGNLVLQHNRINFKGSTGHEALRSVMRDMVAGDFHIKLQLMVLAVGLCSTLDVRVDCMLERRLRRTRWARVLGRMEEVCNVVVFYVRNWKHMEQDIGLQPMALCPKSTTVSVTRRGTMTVRMTWNGIDWRGNEPFERAVWAIATYVRTLI
jgi:hypothetical protein